MNISTKVTMRQYDEMIRLGQFEPRELHHVELIHGEILPKSPVGPPHANLLSLLLRWSIETLPAEKAHIVPGPIGIPALDSEPEPDIFWAKLGDYSDKHPEPEDVLLLIEISRSSLARDRGLKSRLYAEAGIADYWIVNVKDRCIEVRRDPEGPAFRSVEIFHVGQEVHPLAFPDIVLPVSRLFP